MTERLSERVLLPRGRSSPISGSAFGWLRALLEREALVVVGFAVVVAAVVVSVPFFVIQDSWLSFVDGRLIAQHWLPNVDTLMGWTLGRHWIDQQWGGHLVLYELMHHGGLRVAIAFASACVIVALAVIAFAARRLGASPRSTALVLALPIFAAPWLLQLRTQTLALVPFVLVYALLAFDARRPGRRVLWVLPVLVVWANVHGTVALGVVLAALYGLSLVRHAGSRARGFLLVFGSPLCLLASPYGLSLIAYYRMMLVHPPLAQFVTEWLPPTLSPTTAIFFLTALGVVALMGAHWRVLTSFERWALPLLLLLALTAIRDTTWFAFAAAVALPRLIEAARPSRVELTSAVRRLNLIIGSLALVAILVVSTIVFTRPAHWFEHGRSAADAAAVARAAGTDGIVLADDADADWLLWEQPALAGRIAFDVRFELFNLHELRQIQLLRLGSHPVWKRCGATARVVTFAGAADETAVVREHVLAPGSRTIVRRAMFVAIQQPRSSLGRCIL
jgi:hypothetical protein